MKNERIYRAVRTFFQAFIGAVIANIGFYLSGVDNKKALISAVLSLIGCGVAAGIAAVMNPNKKEK
ncbi:MAG: hypothetical protein Q4E28_05045 [Clostridia bacterium]|nr:hypothetical protein [Clostridia bacterium]